MVVHTSVGDRGMGRPTPHRGWCRGAYGMLHASLQPALPALPPVWLQARRLTGRPIFHRKDEEALIFFQSILSSSAPCGDRAEALTGGGGAGDAT